MRKRIRDTNPSQAFFAATVTILGLAGLISGDFTQIWRPVLDQGALRDALVWVTTIVSLGCGIGLLWPRTAGAASAAAWIAADSYRGTPWSTPMSIRDGVPRVR